MSFCLYLSFILTIILLLSLCHLMGFYFIFRLVFNKFPLIWDNKSWKENECHEWFLGKLCPVFHHGTVLPGQEVMSVITFFLNFIPESTIFFPWLVVKAQLLLLIVERIEVMKVVGNGDFLNEREYRRGNELKDGQRKH